MRSTMTGALTSEQRRLWDENGYLLLTDMVSREDVASIMRVVDRHWSAPLASIHEIDLLTGPDAGLTFKMSAVPTGSRNEAYKLNNLFALESEVRRIALAPPLKAILTELLEGEPLICNSLNFERGSQQEFHIDSWYMPAPDDEHMMAASIALEDVDADNGPIVFYPGSHLIQPYRFSHGRLNEVRDEAAACRAYLRDEIDRRGLAVEEVRARAGDVFLWHGQLLHGGGPIRQFARTRNSLVVHYWRVQDVPSASIKRDASGSYLGHTLRGELTY